MFRMQRLSTLCTLSLLLTLALSCRTNDSIIPSPPSGFVSLQIAATTRDCNGPFPQKCLLVKEDNSANWQLFYAPIEGFTYEEGYEYVVWTRREPVPNPPADGSSVRYILEKEVSKTKR